MNELKTLAENLKQTTAQEHERMELLMGKAEVFANKDNYIQFTLSQYYFQLIIEHLFTYPEVKNVVKDLDQRGRSKAVLDDLADFCVKPQVANIVETIPTITPLEALGWIYVSEGSTLGAAFLFKLAQSEFGFSAEYGARNLAAYPDGRMIVWRRFKEALNEQNYSDSEQQEVIKGAMDGFKYYGELLESLKTLR
jgi:heme oxygenase (biliverdin-IX-beta and delta-forming)